MKKPNQLRQVLEQSYPSFVENPDRLQLFLDAGQIIATGANSLSFEYRYTLNVIITDYPDDFARLIVPILAFLRTHQPELLDNPQRRENGFKFQVDYNDNHTADISFEIQLTERVVSKNQGEDTLLTYAKEPTWNDPERLKVYWENWENLIFERAR